MKGGGGRYKNLSLYMHGSTQVFFIMVLFTFTYISNLAAFPELQFHMTVST